MTIIAFYRKRSGDINFGSSKACHSRNLSSEAVIRRVMPFIEEKNETRDGEQVGGIHFYAYGSSRLRDAERALADWR